METVSGWDLTDATFIEEVDDQKRRHRVKYDPGQVTPSVAIIAIVSNITGTDPLELDPLYDAIDFDALDTLFTADMSSVSRLTFWYSECEITVRTDDLIDEDLIEVVAT